MNTTHHWFFLSETSTESFGQLVIQSVLLSRFGWLIKNDSLSSFGVDFKTFIAISMSISFLTMVLALLKYHARSRESLRPQFAVSNILVFLMFVLILVTKVAIYVVGFQNTPALFCVPALIKILINWLVLSCVEETFRTLAKHDKVVYILVSFLVPMPIPTKTPKRMTRVYGISLFLFYLECGAIIFYTFLIKNYYHFEAFREFYEKFPEKLDLSEFKFETIAFLMFLAMMAVTLSSFILLLLYTRCCHPRDSLLKQRKADVPDDDQHYSNPAFERSTSLGIDCAMIPVL